MIDYGQDAHTACVRPDGGRTVADLDVPLDHDPTGSPPWRSGIEAARRALATAAPFVAVEAERDEVLDRPLPAPRLCSGPARPGSWNSEACGLSADDSGLCWFHREGLDG